MRSPRPEKMRQYCRDHYRRKHPNYKPQKHAQHLCTGCDRPGHNIRTCPHAEDAQ